MRYSKLTIILFLLPGIGSFLFLTAYPLISTLYYSLFRIHSYSDITSGIFRGLGNYREIILSPLMKTATINILVFWFVGGVVMALLTSLFAMLLTSGISKRSKNFFRAAIYLPNLITPVAVGMLWTQYIFNNQYGFWKTFFSALGLKSMVGVSFNDIRLVFWGMLIAYSWVAVGWYLLYLLAGIERIPVELYESAKLDGASIIQMFINITLPLLQDVVKLMLIMWSISAINLVAFPMAYSPTFFNTSTLTPAVYDYALAFGGISFFNSSMEIGTACALGVILLAMVLVVAWFFNMIFPKERLEY